MSDALIEFVVTGGVARITLNRPDKMNSFIAPMHAALRDALETIQNDTAIRVLVLTGAGRAFCAGVCVLIVSSLSYGAPPFPHLSLTSQTACPRRLRK